jgi:hypothetical protein
MDISIIPDTYIPSVNDSGNYIDNIPIIRNGLYCPCGSRKDKIYENTTKFANHIKSKSHQKWLMIMNENKANYYAEMLKNKELVENQRKIIAQLENQLKKKTLTIDYLMEELTNKKIQEISNIDLFDLN